MSGLEIAFGIILLVFAVGIIAIVLLQEGQQRNPGVITGGSSDTFLSKHQGRSIDAFLARWTRFIAVGFFIFVIVVNIILFFVPGQANADIGPDLNMSGVASSVTSAISNDPIADLVNDSTDPASQAPVGDSTESTVSDNVSEPTSSTAPAPESNVSAGSQAA